MVQLIVATLLALAPTSAAPLSDEALRSLFLNGYNTYLAEPRSPDVITDHPSYELFRPNGSFSRRIGRFGPEGMYGIEDDRLCVWGDGLPKQCRKLIPQGGNKYLLIDVADGSGAVFELSHVK